MMEFTNEMALVDRIADWQKRDSVSREVVLSFLQDQVELIDRFAKQSDARGLQRLAHRHRERSAAFMEALALLSSAEDVDPRKLAAPALAGP